MAEDGRTGAQWPPPSNAPFSPHFKIRIDAPASLVYEILTSPATWPEWNTFIPSAHLLSRRGADGKQEDYIYTTSDNGVGDAKYKSTPALELGDTVRLNVELPTSGKGANAKRSKSNAVVIVTELTAPSGAGGNVGTVYRAVWDVVEKISRPSASRKNEVEVLGDGQCEYRTWEEMTGLLAYAVKYAVGGAVTRGFEEWAEGLKAEAEKRYQAQQQQ